jgi:undecaprenyl-diphosphatase
MHTVWLDALFLGFLEGLTEFIPVSSTGHLLLLEHVLKFQSPGHTFEVLTQLGAVLAILFVYGGHLFAIARAVPGDRRARRFVAGVVIAFLPAAVVGALAHGFIKSVLFETPILVCATLIVGGIILLIVDRQTVMPRYHNATSLPLQTCLIIGLCQCLALVPGVSRSGSTIVGAMLFGVDKRAAAEFSFFLAIPTMAGAFAYDLFKNRDVLSFDDGAVIAVGFVAAFASAILVARALLDFVSRFGYGLFGWWRILAGMAGFAWLALIG